MMIGLELEDLFLMYSLNSSKARIFSTSNVGREGPSRHGLQHFQSLRRIAITAVTHGFKYSPLYKTPMHRAFPNGFNYHIPRGWPRGNDEGLRLKRYFGRMKPLRTNGVTIALSPESSHNRNTRYPNCLLVRISSLPALSVTSSTSRTRSMKTS
ncbi:hypothetical protein GGR53DRAFT_47407 [Hypoxylon sp. FL1150]|nr:hypothetical protein GGR53DRAFT_47407 [Hypoxylon sp. FL1150]